MFAKLKKKIEEEVGDLGQLAAPLSNTFGGGDRRVSSGGGSSQGTNTPNNIGSRQSSLASLVDLHPIDEHRPITATSPTSSNSGHYPFGQHITGVLSPNVPSPAPPAARSTSNYIASVQQKALENYEVELKRVNNEWGKKLEGIKKSYEEKIQNQEADFAWKYSTKEDEVEKLKVEKRKLEETVKNMEGKMARFQDDVDQMEGWQKQETAKVKHLLLNTQADLQKIQSELFQSEIKVKDLTEENQNIKSENETLLKNLNKLEFGSGKTVKNLEEQLNEFRAKTASLESEMVESNTKLEKALDEARLLKVDNERISKLVAEKEQMPLNAEGDLQKIQSDLSLSETKVKDLTEENQNIKSENETLLKNLNNLELDSGKTVNNLEEQLSEFRDKTASKESEMIEINTKLENALDEARLLKVDNEKICKSLAEKEQILLNAQADLQNIKSELFQSEIQIKDLREENQNIKIENENQLKNLNKLEFETVKNLEEQLNEYRAKTSSLESEMIESGTKLKNALDDARLLKVDNERISKLLAEREQTPLNAEADLQKIQNDLFQSEVKVKELTDENQNIKSENETLLKNLNKLEFDSGKTVKNLEEQLIEFRFKTASIESELVESETKLSDALNEARLVKVDNETIRKSLAEKERNLLNAQADLQKIQKELSQVEIKVKDLTEENQNIKSENEALLKNLNKLEVGSGETVKTLEDQLNEFRARTASLESKMIECETKLKDALDEAHGLKVDNDGISKLLAEKDQTLINAHADLQKIQSELIQSEIKVKSLSEENQNIKSENETHLQNLNKSEFGSGEAVKNLEEQLNEFKAKTTSLESEMIESDIKLENALDEAHLLKVDNERMSKLLVEKEQKLQDVEANLQRVQEDLLQHEVKVKELTEESYGTTTDSKLENALEQIHKLRFDNDVLTKSLREEKNRFRKHMKDHASAVNELKGKLAEPAVIQSSNSHQTEVSNNYTEDVNFQYMRSVLFKFITTSDPQVTKHLTKAVATLLHLNDEEGRLLQKSTDKRIRSWFPGGSEHLS